MRILFAALLAFPLFWAGCATPQPVTSVEILHVEPRYIEEEAFLRIRQYFTGTEHKGNRIILRSQPGAREGYYFVLTLDKPADRLPAGTVIEGAFYTRKSGGDPESHKFKLPSEPPGTKEIFVGLTGEDSPSPDDVPAAWRFRLKGPDGGLLGRHESFLWD